jgi:L-fuculose-phosphate aldolase
MTAGDICLVDLATGDAHPEMLHPSSELPLHLAVYRARARAQAIVHTHSMYATALTTVRDRLPAIHYQIVDLGGVVPVLPVRDVRQPRAGRVGRRGPRRPAPRC